MGNIKKTVSGGVPQFVRVFISNLETVSSTPTMGHIAIYSRFIQVRKKRFFLLVLFERFFFFADSRRKNKFQSVKSPYFSIGQQKKEPLEKSQ